MTPIQQAQLLGRALDTGFQRQMARDPSLAPINYFPKYFDRSDHQYIKGPPRKSDSPDIVTTNLGTFQQQHHPATAEENYKRVVEENGNYGEREGVRTIQLAKAAMAIASRASEAQLQRNRVSAGRNPGVIGNAFPTLETQKYADNFLAKLARFIEGPRLREALMDFGLSQSTGAFDNDTMHSMFQDTFSVGNNLAQAASTIQDVSTRNSFVRNQVAKQARFQRLMPHYSLAASNPQQKIAKVAKQHRQMNGFKPRPNDRFIV